jgi:hypothetical protein
MCAGFVATYLLEITNKQLNNTKQQFGIDSL